jgi:CRISPR-associated endonuclease Csn1
MHIKDAIVLGLDIGPNSIGWALFQFKDGKPDQLLKNGSRVFEAGLDDLETDGKGKSRNTARRDARGHRRLLERRARRIRNLADTLQKVGLFPEGDMEDANERHHILVDLDIQLGSPYKLRARALNEKLNPVELGRTLFHLAQRRGFLSNRKSAPKKAEEDGKVKSAISELSQKMEQEGARTLGEYFSKIDPRNEPIRGRYTSRKMYQDEFEAIWKTQAIHYPELLTDTLKKKIEHHIFFQRPLKSVSHLIGKCELEKGRKRAPWALLCAQRFRYLQKVNDLKILGEIDETGLSDDQRKILIDYLELNGDAKFPKIRKILNLPKTTKFNLEAGGEEKVPGNRTASKVIKIFGWERWQELSEEQRQAIVEDWRSINKEETLKNRGRNHWGLDEDAAENFANINLEDGYCGFSRQAISKLLPYLEKAVPLQTAIRELYPERWERKGQIVELLPRVKSEYLPELRNPIVERALTEVRRVVNSIIGRYGKPDYIHIEMGRELRQTAKQREDVWKKNRANERDRIAAAERLLKEAEIENPSRDDILKIILANECDWICPYTGTGFNLTDIIGEFPQFDIEHIIPFDRCLDDSFMNKTLCRAEENRKIKHNCTPYEAYNGTKKWDGIIQRIKNFKGKAAREKLRRFMMNTEEVAQMLGDDFTSRQLNDTRWTAKWAKQYIGLLYGGADADGIDASGKRRIFAIPSGRITAHMRNALGLNGILGDGPGKTRDDHRHHAVDAIVVALIDQSFVKILSDSARRASLVGKRLLDKLPPPYEGFFEQVRDNINKTITSHRVSKRVRGALHEETFYGKPRKEEKGKQYVHKRIPIEKLKNIEDIVDPAIRNCIKQKLAEIGKEPKEAFKDPLNHPVHMAGDRELRIHRVRIRQNAGQIFPVGQGSRLRYVETDRNHHIAIYEMKDKKGNIKWDGEVVNLYEAYQRLKNGKPIVNGNLGEEKKFLFSLANGEIIELHDKSGKELYVVRSMDKGSRQIRFVPINDARKLGDIGKIGLTAPPDSLRKRHCKKMIVTPLGEIRYAND